LTSSEKTTPTAQIRTSFVWYAGAFILAACYPNTYVIWQGLSLFLGPTLAAIIPFAVTAAVLIAAALLLYRQNFLPERTFKFPNRHTELWVAAGVIIAVAGILATDSNFPAKRIHIPQYFILAVVVRRALLFDLPPLWVFPGVVAITTILSVHDELIQGLLPDRSFGLRDIGVNALGALSGAAIGTGLSLFSIHENSDAPRPRASTLTSIGTVLLGIALMLVPLESFRDISIPIWTILPILAAGLTAGLVTGRDPFSHTRPFAYFMLITMTLPLYLILSHANTINFH
jgi:hypothetical protein